MIKRPYYINSLKAIFNRAPIAALLGPRQCGKTTLARMLMKDHQATYFDLESVPDQRRLENPELILGDVEGLVVLDEIQLNPRLFSVLRVLVDRPDNKAQFLILGSASPDIIRNVSETLAGRVEFLELSGFDLLEVGMEKWEDLWLRGGFPRSFLATSEQDSLAWREGFIQTFLERDIPQLGINIPSVAMRRFWTMLAHYHGQTWNASGISRSMGLSDKTIRSYLDILSGTYMIRQLQPWHVNLGKRQVKSPKIYFRDSGLLHRLLEITDHHNLLGHPKVGASWEGFVIEQVIQFVRPNQAYFWATHNGAEIDMLYSMEGKNFGIEIKLNEAPKITRSMHTALSELRLEHLWVIYPGKEAYPAHEQITVLPISQIDQLPQT
ncbi:MAG: hypothetical protein DRO90_03325 [Candidatus Altiarchaeales archaeon]|nr:MAG: hypothetical protein DRO90_03325 [Candidatus Altiarchaeales archaeon]